MSGHLINKDTRAYSEYNARFDFEGDKIKVFKMFLDAETAEEFRFVEK